VNELEDVPQQLQQTEALDLGRIWNLGMVQVSRNPFAVLGESEEESEEERPGLVDSSSEDDEVPPPPAPLGNGLGRATFARGSGVKMPRVRKWTKPNQKLLFCGEWGICNDNCDCVGEETLIQTVGEEKERTNMGLTFQVAAVKKPLISVKRITEKGNRVCFGPGEEDNFIENRASGDKIKLRQAGKGSYLLDVSFSGGKRTEITVDSGAEENNF
jgi:hypothetical protein